jgi:tight adherence protein B
VRLPFGPLPSLFFKAVSLACSASSLFLLSFAAASHPDNALGHAFARYCARIERNLYRMFIWVPGHRIALAQLGAIFVACLLKLFFALPLVAFLLALAIASLGPELWMARRLRKRSELIEQQVDGLVVALANALKSRPSIADAIASVQSVMAQPMRQEIELVVKQMRVGSTVDQALLSMSGRVASRRLDAAVSAILVGRQVGGNVPEILETTAASMREMSRLEGVVRTKTAEGKAQIWVLAAFPFALLVAFSWASPGYFDPLAQTGIGTICTLIGFGLWAASVISAWRILKVDI